MIRAAFFAITATAAALLSSCSNGGVSPSEIQAALSSGDYARAATLAQAAYEAGESSGEIRYLDALTDLATGDGIGAETNLRAAQAAGIAQAKITPLLAEALARQGKAEEAAALAAKSGGTTTAAIVSGLNAWQAGDPWTAREAFEPALAAAPGNHRLALDLAQVRAELGLFDAALSLCERTAKAQPKNIRAPIIRGDIQMRAHDFAAAKTAYDDALQLLPGNSTALNGKARALYQMRDYTAASAMLSALPDDLRQRSDMQILSAKIAARQGRYDAAHMIFSGLGDGLYNDDEALFLAGAAMGHQGQHWKSARLIEAALRIRPDLPEYHAALIAAYRAAGDEQSASRAIAAIPANLRGQGALQGM